MFVCVCVCLCACSGVKDSGSLPQVSDYHQAICIVVALAMLFSGMCLVHLGFLGHRPSLPAASDTKPD